ncbi:helix-turn-helix domain-containing protein [Streptomyces sp. GS7]|nr:helix-turn-helix domain-containing protein [Streptomyces sp. GS7]
MRRFRGLSLRDLARHRGGFSHHTYGAVLRGDRPMSTALLIALLGACNVDPGPTERWVSILAVVRPSEVVFRRVLAERPTTPLAPLRHEQRRRRDQ